MISPIPILELLVRWLEKKTKYSPNDGLMMVKCAPPKFNTSPEDKPFPSGFGNFQGRAFLNFGVMKPNPKNCSSLSILFHIMFLM